MQCLYCGKQLALLRRLTGGGEFCSDAHKQSYQEEYNRLALSRLLQAQSKPGEIKTKAVPTEGLGAPLPPGSARHRALSNTPEAEPRRAPPAPEPPRYVREEPVETVQPPVEEPEQTIAAGAAVDAREEAVPESVAAEETLPEIAGFSLELPSLAWLPDGIPYVEPYLDATPSASISSWSAAVPSLELPFAMLEPLAIGPLAGQSEAPPAAAIPIDRVEFDSRAMDLSAFSGRSFENQASGDSQQDVGLELFSSLPTANLLRIESSKPASVEWRAMEVAGPPIEFTVTTAHRNVPFAIDPPIRRVFPSALPVTLDVGIAASRATRLSGLNGIVRFPMGVTFENSLLLDLCPAGIDFPAEDAEVILAAGWAERLFTNETETEPARENAVAVLEPSTPRESLEALSRLHDELAAEQEVPESAAISEPAVPVEVLEAVVEQPEVVEAPASEQPAATIEVSAEPVQSSEPVSEEPIPRSAHELLEIPLKTYAPSKPAIMLAGDALVHLAPQAPQLKALPLRPKVAKAPPGYSPQSGAAHGKTSTPEAVAKAPGTAAPAAKAPPRPEVRTKQIPASRPSGKPAQPAKPVPSAKFAPAEKPAVQEEQKAATQAGATPDQAVTAAQKEATTPVQAKAPEARLPEKKAAATEITETTGAETDAMPSFATLQTRKKVPFLASLKLKLMVGIVLMGGAAAYLAVHGGKAPAPAPVKHSNPADDVVVGPSIMMGEGGWVQGWGSDVNGSHAGRQITIYRPSLKLSDYRIEFQAEIDSKSVGWVFRALDPYNYYVEKLAIVSPVSSGHFTLIKYMVQQGHETELGRTPVNVDASAESILNIRTDVHGSTYKTYVQGQAVDTWTDDHFKSGGVGLLNERAERARVKSVSIFYLTGGKN